MDRRDWQARNVGSEARTWLDRDAVAFMHQSGSTPCITAIKRAEGVFLEDHAGKRYIDPTATACITWATATPAWSMR
jgi:4-aminobutyrate aminotransferase